MRVLKNKKKILMKALVVLAMLALVLTTFLPFLSYLL